MLQRPFGVRSLEVLLGGFETSPTDHDAVLQLLYCDSVPVGLRTQAQADGFGSQRVLQHRPTLQPLFGFPAGSRAQTRMRASGCKVQVAEQLRRLCILHSMKRRLFLDVDSHAEPESNS